MTPSLSRTSHAFFCGRSNLAIRNALAGLSLGSCRFPKNRSVRLLEEVTAEFAQRHQQLRTMLLERFEHVRQEHEPEGSLTEQRRLLIGSYFLAEYSLESAASVQSFDRSASRPDGVAAGGLAVHSQFAHDR